jgi:PIN domain nuclease of toxin-antitoxin system
MITAIADTHTAIWYLFSDPQLGSTASAFIDAAVANGDHVGVSAISLAEMVYLIEKGRIPAGALTDLCTAFADPDSVFQHVPVDDKVAVKMAEVSRDQIPDLPDRIIAATAHLRGIPVC